MRVNIGEARWEEWRKWWKFHEDADVDLDGEWIKWDSINKRGKPSGILFFKHFLGWNGLMRGWIIVKESFLSHETPGIIMAWNEEEKTVKKENDDDEQKEALLFSPFLFWLKGWSLLFLFLVHSSKLWSSEVRKKRSHLEQSCYLSSFQSTSQVKFKNGLTINCWLLTLISLSLPVTENSSLELFSRANKCSHFQGFI